MTRSEVIKFLHNQIKIADSEKLKSMVCSCFSPLCSKDCPLKNKNSCECNKIDMENSIMNKEEK